MSAEPARLLLPPALGMSRAADHALRLRAFFGDMSVDVADSYADLERRLLAGQAQLAWTPPIVAARAELHGARPLLRLLRDGQSSYCAALVRRRQGPSPMGGRPLRAAWVDRDSTAGYLLPRAWLRTRGVDDDELPDERFFGSYHAALRELASERADLSAVFAYRDAAGGMRMPSLNELAEDEQAALEVVAVTEPVPNDVLTLAPGVSATEARELEERLLTLITPEGRLLLADVFGADGLERAGPGGYVPLYPLLLASFGAGAPLRACSSCGTRATGAARYCQQCGAMLEGAPPSPFGREDSWVEERKLATIVFADISGFTKVSSQLEPDEVRDFANACLGPLAAEIEVRGGTVVKYLGDAIMAAFGVPRTAEDDARRAVQAALAMTRRLLEISPDVERRFGAPIALRVGVNTGLVMVGAVGGASHRTRDIMGGAVNLASRIESVARPGEVLVGRETFRLTEPDFSFEYLGPMEFKGIERPVGVYRALGEAGEAIHSGTGTYALDVAMGVRQRELRMLQAAFDEACVLSTVRAMHVRSEPGQGQRWLLRAFAGQLAADARAPQVLEAAAGHAASTARRPLSLVGQLLRRRFATSRSAGEVAIRRGVRAGVLASWSDPTHPAARAAADALAEVAAEAGPRPAMDVRQLSTIGEDRALRAFVDWVAQMATHGPVVFVLRELQWADPSSTEILGAVFRLLGRVPVLLVLASRSDTELAWIEGVSEGQRSERMELHPLGDETMGVFVDHLLRRLPDAPAEIAEAIVRRAEGSPECAREIVRLLVDRGVIVVPPGDGSWRWVAERFDGMELPANIRGILQSRLDRLERDQKLVLTCASVCGRAFWPGAVAPMTGLSVDEVSDALRVLVERGLVQRTEQPEVEGSDEHSFRSQSMFEIAYESLPADRRGSLHAVVADWLQHASSQAQRARVAWHHERAGRKAEARAGFLAAAREAALLEGNAEAAALYEAALAAWPPNELPEARSGALLELGIVLARIGRFDEAAARVEQARAAELQREPAASADTLSQIDLEHARIERQRGDDQAALDQLDSGLARADLRSATLRVALLAERMFVLARRGDERFADDKRTALALAPALTDSREDVRALAPLWDGIAYERVLANDLDEAEEAFGRALELRTRAGDPRGEVLALTNLTALAHRRGDFDLAVERGQRALARAEDVKRARDIAICACNLGQSELETGALGEARAHLRRAVHLAEENSFLDVLADGTRALALARLADGDTDGALHDALDAVAHAERAGVLAYKLGAHAAVVSALCANPRLKADTTLADAAREHLDAARAIVTAGGAGEDVDALAAALETALA